MSHCLLVELGVEELPASYAAAALRQLETQSAASLREARLGFASHEVMGTPRRLTVCVQGLAAGQQDLEERLFGPPARLAVDPKTGEASAAARAFAKRAGLSVDALEHAAQPGKSEAYLSCVRKVSGLPAMEVLPELIGSWLDGLSFPKTMRWGAGDTLFARPVQWLVALLDETVVPLRFAGLTSGRRSYGHRLLAPDAFELDAASTYGTQLERKRVLVRPAERAMRIRALCDAAAEAHAAQLASEAILDESSQLVEWPELMEGEFDPDFLALPRQLVEAVLTVHQKYIPLRSAEGKALPRYLNIINVPSTQSIVRGNNRVLKARLDDAAFFVREDEALGLDKRLESLETTVFHRKLGTTAAKVRRVSRLSASLAQALSAELSVVEEAARYAKADLATLTVGEFPELEGTFGGWLLRRAGRGEAVATAVAEHYAPRGAHDALPDTEPGAVLASADRLDTLVGCLAAGEKPTGSADPFGLRRIAIALLRLATDGPFDLDLRHWVRETVALLRGEALEQLPELDTCTERLESFLTDRFAQQLKQRFDPAGASAALAAWSAGATPRQAVAVAQARERLAQQGTLDKLSTLLGRLTQMVAKLDADSLVVHKLALKEEQGLAAALERAEAPMAYDARDSVGVLSEAWSTLAQSKLEALAQAITDFFETVFVMSEVPEERATRLALLYQAWSSFGWLRYLAA